MNREKIKMKYGGRCAYSGTVLEDDWQIDHVKPIRRNRRWKRDFPEHDCESNMVPTQAIINHYKHALPLHLFRTWYLGGLHRRLAKLPKNPRTEKSIRYAKYMRKVASYFGITPDKPFCGKFYFEKIRVQKQDK